MTNKVVEQCKRKGCFNPVMDGKYCEHCKQKKKEKRNIVYVGVGGPAIIGLGVAIKKGVIKQGPKIASKVVQVISRKL